MNNIQSKYYRSGVTGVNYLIINRSVYTHSELLLNNTIRVIECNIDDKEMNVHEKKKNDEKWKELDSNHIQHGVVIDLNDLGDRWEGSCVNGSTYGFGCLYNSDKRKIYSGFMDDGMKVFYGDATRMDLLESAGAAKAEVLINAIDDPQTNLQLTEMVKEHFPHLQIIARARDVDHYIRLRQAGVEKPERETFEGALKTGRLALESLGLGPYEARERADVFRRFNIQMVEEMAMVENDTKARAAVYKRTSAMLSEIITEDREHLSLIQRHGWQGTEEGKHTGNMADEPETKPSS